MFRRFRQPGCYNDVNNNNKLVLGDLPDFSESLKRLFGLRQMTRKEHLRRDGCGGGPVPLALRSPQRQPRSSLNPFDVVTTEDLAVH